MALLVRFCREFLTIAHIMRLRVPCKLIGFRDSGITRCPLFGVVMRQV